MGVVILIGRILYGIIFVSSGIMGHLMDADSVSGYAQSRGMKEPKLMVQASGVLMAAGGLGVILGIWGDLAALGLAVYCLVSAVAVHGFWKDEDPTMKQMEMTMFMKNLALVGGGLILFALMSLDAGANVDFTITDPLFDTSL